MRHKSRLFWAVGVGHLTNDVFASMGPVLLAFLSASILPMSNTQIGLAVSLAQLMGAVSQPGFGILADRTGGRWIGSLGLAFHVGMFTLSIIIAATTHQYWLMFIPFVTATIGSGALHPVGSLHAAEAEANRSGTNIALFFMMGQMGLALGPTIAGVLLDTANPNVLGQMATMINLPYYGVQNNVTPIIVLSLVSIPGILFMVSSIPAKRQHLHPDAEEQKSDAINGNTRVFPLKAFLILGAMVTLRGLGQPGSVAFIPVLFEQKGWDPSAYGAITSSFWIASAISGVVFGRLADQYDRRKVMMFSMLASAPAFFLLPSFDGPLAFALAVAAGGLSGGAHSIIVVLAQDLIPMRKGFASGAILGFIFGTGAIGSFIIGAVSDQIGLTTTFQIVAFMIAAAGIISMFLPKQDKQVVTG
jgi:MFS transporter, FSR family, fosmidomycin resistance protein